MYIYIDISQTISPFNRKADAENRCIFVFLIRTRSAQNANPVAAVDYVLFVIEFVFERGACRTGSAHGRYSTFPKAAQGRPRVLCSAVFCIFLFVDVNLRSFGVIVVV